MARRYYDDIVRRYYNGGRIIEQGDCNQSNKVENKYPEWASQLDFEIKNKK